jgi:chromosomal replication initiator protein
MPGEARRIIAAAAAHFGVEVNDVLSPSRMRKLVQPRHVAMWLLRQRGLSFPQIARRMNRGDHTTALHGARAVEASDKLLAAAAEIVAKLKAAVAPAPTEGEGADHG